MKKYLSFILICWILFFISLSSGTLSNLYGQDNNITIIYQGIKNDLTIKESCLTYSWHSTPPDTDNVYGPQQYIGKSVKIDLTPPQLKELKKWAEDYHVLNLKNPDFIGNMDSPLYSYRHILSIKIEDTKLTLSWTGVSTWKDLQEKNKIEKAIDKLKRLCLKFIKEGNSPD